MQLQKIKFTEFLYTYSNHCIYQLFMLTLTVCFDHNYLMLANFEARRQTNMTTRLFHFKY